MPNSMSNWATAQKSATTARMNAVLCSSKSESEVQCSGLPKQITETLKAEIAYFKKLNRN